MLGVRRIRGDWKVKPIHQVHCDKLLSNFSSGYSVTLGHLVLDQTVLDESPHLQSLLVRSTASD